MFTVNVKQQYNNNSELQKLYAILAFLSAIGLGVAPILKREANKM